MLIIAVVHKLLSLLNSALEGIAALRAEYIFIKYVITARKTRGDCGGDLVYLFGHYIRFS